MQPEERVKAFIADFHQAHSRLGPQNTDDAFDRWAALVETLDQTHFVDHGGRELAGVIEGNPPHTIKGEPIVGTRRAGERVFVETRVAEAGLPKFYEYELREVDAGDWRIARIRLFLDPPDAPFMTARARPGFENPKIHPLRKLSAEEAHVDGSRIFAAGKSVKVDGKESTIEVRDVGRLNVTTGILVVGDLGYSAEDLTPVGQRVPPGSYRADVAIAFGRNAGLRIRFSDQKVARWHPADMGEGGHVVGVDAGDIAVMDLAAVMTLNARDKERAFESYGRAEQRPNSRMLSLVGTNDTVIADSGWGDGRYPVYWGVDAGGRPVVLLVDFLVVP